jgi:hypothetical protein
MRAFRPIWNRAACFRTPIGALLAWCCFSTAVFGDDGYRDAPAKVVEQTQSDAAPTEIVQPPEVLPPIEDAPGLALEQLQQMALSANPSVARAEALVGAARGNWLQVGLPPNPNVGYEGQQLGSGGLAEQHGVVFNQEIVRGGKLKLNRLVAQREVLVAEQELENSATTRPY